MTSTVVAAFGIFISGLSIPVTMNLVTKVFKTEYYRPGSLFLDRFERNPRACDRCEKAVANDLKLILDVRANGDSKLPTEPPQDLAHYKASLQKVLDRYRGKVALLVVEHEPDVERFYWKGSAADYLKQLRAACEVAHRNKIQCTDGGLSSQTIAALLTEHYLSKSQPEKAQSFNKRISETPIRTAEQLEKAKEMLYGFRAAGVDYLNFHWYEKDRSAFLEVIDFLKKAGGGLPVMTNELGQHSDDPAETIWKLEIAQRAGFPFVVWFSVDAGNLRSLVNSDGSLRPTGEAFRRVTAK